MGLHSLGMNRDELADDVSDEDFIKPQRVA